MAKKILIVDDEPDIIKVLARRLQEQSYEVSTALDANEALLKIRQGAPDLIILDIMMPGTSGNEFAQRLKNDKSTSKIPIIFLSALQTKEEEQKQGGFVGGNVILAKPYEIQFLIAKIEEMTN